MRKAIIGIGNPLKGDDNIGNLVVDELKKEIRDKDILFIRSETNPENFIGKIKSFNPNAIYFVDAVEFDGKVGDVRMFSIDSVLNESLSTHGISVKVFREFFPDTEIYVVGIKPGEIGYGESLSTKLKKEFGSITDKVNRVLNVLPD